MTTGLQHVDQEYDESARDISQKDSMYAVFASDHINYLRQIVAVMLRSHVKFRMKGRSRRHGLLSGLSVIDRTDVKLFGRCSFVRRCLSTK